MLEAVIFDMDGVIIDSEPFHLEVIRQIFGELGIKFSEEEYANYVGFGNEEMWTDIKDKHSLTQSVAQLKDLQISKDIEHIRGGHEKPIPGVTDLLKNISSNDIPVALASSSSMQLIELIIGSFGLRKYFTAIVSGENMERGKPEPDIFLHTATLLNVPPKACVVIEDSRNGVTAAKAAGMRCIGFRNPNSANQDISGADLIIDNLTALNVELLYSMF